MKEIITLEILGVVGILAVYNIWNISYQQYSVSLIFLVAVIGADILLQTESRAVICTIKDILLNKKIESALNTKALIGIRRLGLFIILSGIVGITSILILSNWVFIGIDIIGNGIGITSAIILNTLIIETTIILPVMLKIKYQKIQKGILKRMNRYNGYMSLNKIK